jgi:magnesium transporter
MPKRKTPLRAGRKKSTRAPVGAVPGLISAHPDALPSRVNVMAYDEGKLVEERIDDVAQLAALRGKHAVIWVDVAGLANVDLIRRVGEIFDLHPLALEDVVHTHQRPKVEEYPSSLYLTVRTPEILDEALDLEQISFFLGEGFVLTFQERDGDCFEPVRERLRRSRGKVRRCGPDYLAYALLDAIVDSYFPHVESYGDRLEELQDQILTRPDQALVHEIHSIKRDLLAIRRTVWPLREAINGLLREEHAAIREETRLYLRDVYDHTVQLVELTELHREVVSGLLDIYLSSVSNRMNEVMKVLTIIATIFIPLSFVASVYGMNFDREASPFNMPELGWRYGYPFALGLMASIATGLLVYFRRRGWL